MTFTIIPEIIFENDDYLVINKPSGLAVHGGGNIKDPTLADWLIASYPEIADVGDDPIRPGLVHRLDKEVSGLMVVAKNAKTFATIKAQFKDRDVNKEYVALVHGKLASDYGTINFPIKRSSEGYKMAAMPNNTVELLSRPQPSNRDQGNLDGLFKSREAITEYTVLKRFTNYTLVQVKIKTGRTHQIRVHFFALGYPLVGDNLYFNKKSKAQNKKLDFGRIFLAANKLSFKDNEGKIQSFSLDLPAKLNDFLLTLK
ncbi:MAG: RNA pseudouridine synthase [Patescibacteria group bacterium]